MELLSFQSLTSSLVLLLSCYCACVDSRGNNVKKECVSHLQPDEYQDVDIKFNRVPVPVEETSYLCRLFDITLTSDHHMIGVLPLIDTKEVVHHILLFGCDPRARVLFVGNQESCSMMPPESCRNLIGAWTMGSDGECVHPSMGFRVGPNGYTQVYMQAHFNNPNHLKGLRDSSGLRLQMTTTLRANDAGMLTVGQRQIQINPLSEEGRQGEDDRMTVTARCPSRCTKHMFGEGIYITSAVNHMHDLGLSQRIEVFRNNKSVYVITDQDRYSYNHPRIFNFPEPLHVLPGDEIKTSCEYKRPNGTDSVCFGESTSDEMCFGFLTYFPLQRLSHPWCTSMGQMVSCDRHLPQLGKHPIDECRWWEFRNMSNAKSREMFGDVLFGCMVANRTLICTDRCKKMVSKLIDHPCMQGNVGSYMIDRFKKDGLNGEMIMDALVTCSCRQFSYCDRKLPNHHMFLGSQQEKWCPKSEGVMSCSTHWLAVPVLLVGWMLNHFIRLVT